MSHKKLLIILIVAMAIGAFVQGNALAADTIRWKAQAFWSAAELPYKTFVESSQRGFHRLCHDSRSFGG